jgi:hypothetical protein
MGGCEIMSEYIIVDDFTPTSDLKATKALQFYEDYADSLHYIKSSEENNEFDWDRCRAYCRIGKKYSHQRFMTYVSEWFGTPVKEMKSQWRNIRYDVINKNE